MGVKIKFDKKNLVLKIKNASKESTKAIADELLKDANYYCKKDSGELIKSSIISSKLEEGLLIWNTPYAKRQYYTGKASKDDNPNATTMWAHKAIRKNKRKYEKMAQKITDSEV